jgi:hypothetical protein
MKTICAIVSLFIISPLALADYTMPEAAPKVTCPKAVEVATSKLKDHSGSPDSYIDRMTLVGSGDKKVWVIWFASPSEGYTILAVEMNGRVRKASQEEIDTARGSK